MAAVASCRLLSALPRRILAPSTARAALRACTCTRDTGLRSPAPGRILSILPLARTRSHYPLLSVASTSQIRSYTTQSEVVEKVNEEIESLSPNKVFAVVHISGRQFKIANNDLIVINRITADIGEKIILEKILLAGSEKFTLIGTPLLSNEMVRVTATVTEHSRSAKVIVFKKKRRKNYKRKRGHRQDMTVLRINDIHLSSAGES